MDRRVFWRMVGSTAAFGLTGCVSPWGPSSVFEAAALPELPQPRMSPDAVILEVAVVRFGSMVSMPPRAVVPSQPPGGEDYHQQPASSAPQPAVIDRGVEDPFWKAVDEQAVSVSLRNELRRNGFRAGVLRGTLPEELRRQLDEQRASAREIDPENAPGSLGSSVQRLQSRSGKRSKLLMGEPVESLSLFSPDGERLSGRTFLSAQCLLSVKSFARGDGGAELEITPEVEHGEARQRWMGQSHEGTYRLDANRQRWQLEKLRCRFSLTPGQLVVMSCVDPPIGAGASFFARDGREAGSRRVVLIRLAQTQVDELFTERPASAALTTPLE